MRASHLLYSACQFSKNTIEMFSNLGVIRKRTMGLCEILNLTVLRHAPDNSIKGFHNACSAVIF